MTNISTMKTPDQHTHIKYLPYRSTMIITIASLVLLACSSEIPVTAQDGNSISFIKIKLNGAANADRPDMIDTCKGFLLTKTQISDFFIHSSPVKDQITVNSFSILPCYVSGTAIINQNTAKWIIRSGGIGDFHTQNKEMIRVCGQTCCEKLPGIC